MMNKKYVSTFQKYYGRWKAETFVSAIVDYNNKNYRALLDPKVISFNDMCLGLMDVLQCKDDHIAILLEDRIKSEFGIELFETNGYVSLMDYCRMVKMTLALILNGDLDPAIEVKKVKYFNN